ncbi:MAG: hypothetical protein V4629_03345 [Pseudomonadota bacterium]
MKQMTNIKLDYDKWIELLAFTKIACFKSKDNLPDEVKNQLYKLLSEIESQMVASI